MFDRLVIGGVCAACALAVAPASALDLFETPGITHGDDPVECTDLGTYRHCVSDTLSERVLSHDGLPVGDRIPLAFHLYLPPEPASGPDGNYPLVVFIHGWTNSKTAPGGNLQTEFVPYAEAGYAVLAYDARGWNETCGSNDPSAHCVGQWNRLADVRYEVRDTQYFAGLLVDELSDTGHPIVDAARIGVNGVSYGGGQSTMLASLRNRVVNTDNTVSPWTSPFNGTPLSIAAAAPYWAWTDLAYSLVPNGRTLDYASNNSYRGPLGTNPFGVMKASYVSGFYLLGQAQSKYAPPLSEPDLNTWYSLIVAGEPYTEIDIGPIADEIRDYHTGITWLDPAVPPAPTLFNSGWSDDIFPVSEPVRYIQRARVLHPGVPVQLAASDYGHARARSTDESWAKALTREWFDHFLMGIGPQPGPNVRARIQNCPSGSGALYTADDWDALSPGEVRLQPTTSGNVLSAAGPSSASGTAFDPIAPPDDPCTRVADETVAGSLVVDFPAPDSGGYTVLGSPTVIADLTVTGTAPDSMLIARLLDVDASGDEMLLARTAYRPDASGRQVFQLHPIGSHIPDTNHLQLELLGNEAPTARPSNVAYSIAVSNLDVRIPVAEAPDGQQIAAPEPPVLPPGYELAQDPLLPLFGTGGLAALVGGLLAVGGWAATRRHARQVP